jgi:hypothetical protein
MLHTERSCPFLITSMRPGFPHCAHFSTRYLLPFSDSQNSGGIDDGFNIPRQARLSRIYFSADNLRYEMFEGAYSSVSPPCNRLVAVRVLQGFAYVFPAKINHDLGDAAICPTQFFKARQAKRKAFRLLSAPEFLERDRKCIAAAI